MLYRFGVELREVFWKLSDTRQSENNGPVHGFEARRRERGHPLGERVSLR